jgi:prolyl 4-hydroxylase
MFSQLLYFFVLVIVPLAIASNFDERYGMDCSFPVHSTNLNCQNKLGDRQSIYVTYMQGCRDRYGASANRCDSTESDRLSMNLRQPQSMVNYTSTGFMKITAPKEVRELLNRHWELNADAQEKEEWGIGNIYTNNWASPTYMVSVENTKLIGGGIGLKQRVWDAVQSTIEQWTGMELRPTSVRFC